MNNLVQRVCDEYLEYKCVNNNLFKCISLEFIMRLSTHVVEFACCKLKSCIRSKVVFLISPT